MKKHSTPAFVTGLVCTLLLLTVEPLCAVDVPRPDYVKHVAPIFKKYCNGCHNAEDAEGKLNMENFAAVMRGGKRGAAIVPKKSSVSRMILVLEKKAKPFMPPEGSQGPTAAEITVLKSWIDGGAIGPSGQEPDPTLLITPKIAPSGTVRKPINSVATSGDGKWIAVARYGSVEILSAKDRKRIRTLAGFAGQVNDVGFSRQSDVLFAAGGEAGLFGEVQLWNTSDWKLSRTIRGHRDGLYTAAFSPDGKILATGSYDEKIKLWQVATGKELRMLTGHNGAIFDLAFHPSGKMLASASGDTTVKLWDVATGTRLDTLGQPTKEQYAVAFRPDGTQVVGGGVDNRIRVWEIRQMGKEGTNPLVYSRFAHEEPIIDLAFSPNGRALASSSEDQFVKIWETDALTLQRTLEKQPDWAAALAFAPDNKTLLAGRLDGSLGAYQINTDKIGGSQATGSAIALTANPISTPHASGSVPTKLPEVAEVEPNDQPGQATLLSVPGIANGIVVPANGQSLDADLFRFAAKAGQTWIIETNAARLKSPLDTRIEVLDAKGSPVPRLLFRAVRDSYITFRPIDSKQTQIRVKNWEEMELNQYLYMNGEVGKFFRMPQGPDSGMLMYNIGGKRQCYFDTTATIHAKESPIYIVEPYLPGSKLIDNGLPVFPLNYANDDDGERKLGSDSRLTFTAPANGNYLVRVTDIRGFSGPNYKYQLTVRQPKPDFKITVGGKAATVAAGSGQRFTIKLDRIDSFDGPVRFDISGLPAGFQVSSPIVVEAGHLEARGVINALADAKTPKKEAWSKVKITATATINGADVTKAAGDLGEIKLAAKPKVIVVLEQDQAAPSFKPSSSSSNPADANTLVITPGTTITAMLRIERNGFKGELKFDVDNLPHGVIVDNIGLSGVLVRVGENERQIFLTASDWVDETSRWIHAVAKGEGNQASLPILLKVKARGEVAQARSQQ